MTEYVTTEFPHPFPLSPEVGNSALPQDWQSLAIDEQVIYLKNNRMFTRPEIFVAASLEIAARRMDTRDEQQGKSAVHLTALTEQWHGEQAGQAYTAGMSEHVESEVKHPAAAGFICSRIVTCFGMEYINPRILGDITGKNRMTGRGSHEKPVLLGEGTYGAMRSENWSRDLVALAGMQYLRQASSKAAKDISGNMLCPDDELPRIKDEPDAAERFWRTKLGGTTNSVGIAYFLGYRDKLSPAMTARMRSLWKGDYSDNRQIFTAALNIYGASLGSRLQRDVQHKLRRPVYALIQHGHFDEAHEMLAQAAASDHGRQIFSPISLRFLLGPDYSKEKTPDPGAPILYER